MFKSIKRQHVPSITANIEFQYKIWASVVWICILNQRANLWEFLLNLSTAFCKHTILHVNEYKQRHSFHLKWTSLHYILSFDLYTYFRKNIPFFPSSSMQKRNYFLKCLPLIILLKIVSSPDTLYRSAKLFSLPGLDSERVDHIIPI